MFKSLVQHILSTKAQQILRQFHPRIVAITGSVGKTTTKEAVALVVSQKYRVLKNEGNLNTDFGIPLTILGLSPATTPWGWAMVVAKALWLKPKTYAEVLVLEFGIDHPGDMAKLAAIAQPHIVIETGVSSVHLQHFPHKEALVEEKASLLDYLPADGVAILNADNPYSLAMRNRSGTWKRITYGFVAELNKFELYSPDVSLESIEMSITGMTLHVCDMSRYSFSVTAPVIGHGNCSAILASIAVGRHLGIAPDAITKALDSFTLPPGRLNTIEGISGSTIIDSTYNAEPESMRMAITALRDLPAKRRIAVLGDMLELGTESENAHQNIGAILSNSPSIHIPIFVGSHMKAAYHTTATRTKQYFETSTEAAAALPALIQPGDLILIKGSQGARMERVTKALMAHPEEAPKLLVRQSAYWLAKV